MQEIEGYSNNKMQCDKNKDVEDKKVKKLPSRVS